MPRPDVRFNLKPADGFAREPSAIVGVERRFVSIVKRMALRKAVYEGLGSGLIGWVSAAHAAMCGQDFC